MKGEMGRVILDYGAIKTEPGDKGQKGFPGREGEIGWPGYLHSILLRNHIFVLIIFRLINII